MCELYLFPSGEKISEEAYYSRELLRLESERKWDHLSDLVNELYSRDVIEVSEKGYPIYVGLEKNQTFVYGVQFEFLT